jgi:hypothetical protein
MPLLTKKWIDRQKEIAENTWVAETASGVIVISHPGQKPPDPKDRKFLRENFGLLPDVEIKKLIDTDHAPPIERLEAELALQDSTIAERKAYHAREYVKLALEEAAAMGLPVTPAIAREAEGELADALNSDEDEDEDGDKSGRTVSTVGRRRSPAAKD